MKRTPLKRKTGFKKPGGLLRRAALRQIGKSPTALLKRQIQATLREIVMKRDGGCILRKYRHCGGEIGQVVIQADHLVTRANSATYADHRLVVCLCRNCHGWKHWHEKEYDSLVKKILPKNIVELWEKCEIERQSHRTKKMNWAVELAYLKQELSKYEN